MSYSRGKLVNESIRGAVTSRRYSVLTNEDNMGIGIWELIIILAILLLLFGTKRLQTLGGDLGVAIRGFRSAMNEKDSNDQNGSGPH